MEQKSKTYIRPIFIVMIFVFITIGYAYLTSSLNINGSTLLKKPTWDVHFENVQVKSGSVTGNQVTQEPTITNDTTVTFHVNLKKPGDFYEFTVDAVNAGTIDAMIDTYTNLELTEAQQAYLEASVTYEDGEEIQEHQQLLAGDTAVYKIRVGYKLDLEADDLPTTSQQLSLSFTVNHMQRDAALAVRRNAEMTLYNVFKEETGSNGMALKYNGAHQDSMDASLSIKDIYYWAPGINGDSIKNKWNVIFADHCWQMIRTTDTGGVKLLYNGEVNNGQCLSTRGNHVGYAQATTQYMYTGYYYGTSYIYDSSTQRFTLSGTVTTGEIQLGQYSCRSYSATGTCSTLYYLDRLISGSSYYVLPINNNSHYSQFGTLQFNQYDDSPSYLGYMYNKVYNYQYKQITENDNLFLTTSLSTSYWYADDIAWGNPTANRYNLVNPYQVSSSDDYTSLVGKYTFRSSSNTTNTSVYYIVAVSGSTMVYIQLSDSTNHNLSDYNDNYTFGNSYTDNGNGTYTINNPTTISRVEWYTRYSEINSGQYFCKNAVNNTCSDLLYTTSDINRYNVNYFKTSNNYKYSKSFTWDGSKYVLDDSVSTSFWDFSDNVNINSLDNAHYTCRNNTGECTSISYVHHLESFRGMYYLELFDGKSIEDALNEMFYDDDVNTINSTIKSGVDAWFERYLLPYSDYLEDTIFCEDRSFYNPETNYWNPNGGKMSTSPTFGARDLSCQNVTDRFNTQNDKARLKYKVGLIRKVELELLNSMSLRDVNKSYWIVSPYAVTSRYTVGYNVSSGGYYGSYNVNSVHGVRPFISLKSGILFSSGDGSMANPYVVSTN